MALDQNIKNQLAQYLEMIKNPVELVAYRDSSQKSDEMYSLLEEIQKTSKLISLVEQQDKELRTPSFSVGIPNNRHRIFFAGIPMGHEFTSLILSLLQTGGHPLKISQELIDQIKNINGDFHFETFISLSCHNCPDIVQALNLISLINENISHVMIDGALFQQEVENKKIMSVPTIFLNGEKFGQGRMDLEEIISKIDSSAKDRIIESISKKAPYDVLIVGGGPAGASAAVYSARKGIRTALVAERFGGQVMDTLGIENFISVKATEGPKLVSALEEHVKDYEVDIINLQRVNKLFKNGGPFYELKLESGAKLESKSVILATGARWRELGIPGESEFRGKGVAYCPHCDGPLFKGKNVAVIGGGNSGVEAAIDLAGIVKHVTLVEFAPSLKADQILIDKLNSLKNIEVILNTETKSIFGSDKVQGFICVDRDSLDEKKINVEGIFIQIGLIPNTDWLKGTLNLSPYGEIEINQKGETSLPGVFAAGDVTTTPYKQIIIAMGEGSKAALGAFDHLIRSH
ncbi:MAG: alkyl hydroperoxide reductase subunit F [Methylophilaceae bacterium]